jgi:sugar phosphate isomerase/epimerase
MKRIDRRDAIRLAGAGLVSSLASGAENQDPAAIARKPSPEFHGLMIGLASYSTRNLSVDDTIACCRRLGIKHIALKDSHLKLTSTPEERAALRKKFSDSGIAIVGCGVIYVKNDEAEIRRAFQYAKDIGAATAVMGCTRDVVPTMSKVIQDFDLRAAIHNHGPTDERGSKSPIDVMEWIKDADKKIGLCMDVGHTFHCGVSPTVIATKYASRLYDIHIKDQGEASATRKDVPVGQGVIDIVGLLKTLVKTKYPHHVALEYEAEANNPLAGITESIGYERGVLAAL